MSGLGQWTRTGVRVKISWQARTWRQSIRGFNHQPSPRYLQWRLDHLIRPPKSHFVVATQPVRVPPGPRQLQRRQGHSRGRSPKVFLFFGHKSTFLLLKPCWFARDVSFIVACHSTTYAALRNRIVLGQESWTITDTC